MSHYTSLSGLRSIKHIPWHRVSRVDTTLSKTRYMVQVPMWFHARDVQRWATERMRIRAVENDKDGQYNARDVKTYSSIVRQRHYLKRWPVKPETKVLAYLADIDGVSPGPAGAAGMAMFGMQAGQLSLLKAITEWGRFTPTDTTSRRHGRSARGACSKCSAELHQHIETGGILQCPTFQVHPCSVISLVRFWRADDLDATFAPYFSPSMLSRIICGHRESGLPPLASVWERRKCTNGLTAKPRLLITYADPSMGHDGGLYRAAGARYCGHGSQGKMLFAWALDPVLRRPLLDISAGFR